jgi:hypothetical protein
MLDWAATALSERHALDGRVRSYEHDLQLEIVIQLDSVVAGERN